MPHLIQTARDAQQRASRAAAHLGARHPITRVLLALAAMAAAAAWDAGHPITDTHPHERGEPVR
ncbi:hypothetical protein [Streptomyces sp. NRRL F-5065]|uniref:hypothetical protein n=1 Tax=Streptomyces sp. NRRL F-5065 TaxID=1463855 RepID=UPI00099B390C|nr:hypothetical protein [Streptomyces sp. NRRL F-5065]